MSHDTDLPPELGSYSDGVSDDAAYHPELIGCGSNCVGSGLMQHVGGYGGAEHLMVSGYGGAEHLAISGLGDLAVGGYGGAEHLAISGLGDLAVMGLPAYALTAKGLRNPVVRRRFAAAIERLTPKVRRRVLGRLKALASRSLVSGGIRDAYPSISGSGWSGVSVGRCPYASVAGPLTP